MLDRCSASVDLDTDERLQRMIQEEFVSATVLTIAHRLDTVMKCDRIIVMDAGKVAEFGTPKQLEAAGGIFSSLVASSQNKKDKNA